MKFFTYLFVIFNLFFSNFAFSEIIKKINIEGNKRISGNTILVLSNLKAGDDLSKEDLNKTLKNLYNTDFFKNIDINLDDGLLKITVTEYPIIEYIKINGIKNKGLNETLLERISLRDRLSFNEFKLKNDINLIMNVLKTNGYYFATVKTSLDKNEELNSVRIIIDINQGKKARIKEISFIGTKNIKDKKLLEIIASQEHKFWKFLSKQVFLNQNTINLDKRLLENYYKNLGYYNVKILETYSEFNTEGYFKLTYNIESGNQYYFNNLTLNLPDDYNQDDFSDVLKLFNKFKLTKFSLDNFNLILDKIYKIASLRLYDFIDAKVSEKIVDENKIDFVFNIVDSKKFYVEKINIFGNNTTIEEVIRNKLIVDEGDPLNSLLYNKSIDSIKSLNFFREVEAKIKDGSNENLKIIDISVEEKPTGEISLAAGFGTAGSSIGTGISERNFLGKGIDLNTNLEISDDSVKGKFVYSRPNFAYTDNTLFTSFQSTTSDFLKSSGYKLSKTGFSIGTKIEQYENFFFSPEIDLSFEDLETNSTASSSLKKQQGAYDDLYFNYSIDYDLRNSQFRPSSGNKISFFQELPLASKSNEISNIFTFSQYKTLNNSSNMIGRASLYLKTVNSIEGSDVRISKRAKVPYNRLRGFKQGKVGPIDNNDYIGGNYVSTLNLSTNLPGILTTFENIEFSYFLDVANIWGVDYDDDIDDSNFIRSSTGLGVDFLTPIGPLSFSLSEPITKKSTDITESFRFNLGTTF